MIKAFSTKHIAPLFKKHETIEHEYPSYSHIIKEKIWMLNNGTTFHRFYVMNKHGIHKEFVCDMITDEQGTFPRAQENAIYICDKHGHEWMEYTIKRNA